MLRDDDLDDNSAGSADEEELGLSIEERVVLKDMERRLRQCEAQQKEIPKPDMHLSPLKILVAKAKSQGECRVSRDGGAAHMPGPGAEKLVDCCAWLAGPRRR